MALLLNYLDGGFTEYFLLDINDTIVQPKNMCDISEVPEDFQEQLDEIAQDTNETIYLNKPFFKDLEEGDEVSL
jgi:hypothetical protein